MPASVATAEVLSGTVPSALQVPPGWVRVTVPPAVVTLVEEQFPRLAGFMVPLGFSVQKATTSNIQPLAMGSA